MAAPLTIVGAPPILPLWPIGLGHLAQPEYHMA